MRHLLIIANSARMLVQAAHQEGFIPLVIDRFADSDTRQYAKAWRQVGSLSLPDLTPAVEGFLARYPVTRLVYGSGFEAFPKSLAYLGKRLALLGNAPDTFAKINHKRDFFQVLDGLSLPYPASAFSEPLQTDGWLCKPLAGQGGVGIKHWQPGSPVIDCYWQRHQPGIPHSVLFLADGQAVKVLGFNRQWTQAIDDGPFVFSGITNQTSLSPHQQAKLTGWLAQLVPAFKLRGLNSLDFIQDGDDSWLLEINPRPPASMQLYTGGLLTGHIAACEGVLPVMGITDTGVSAYQIVYATDNMRIPENMAWPEGCLDLPQAGVICRTGEPICSIIAHHKGTRHKGTQSAHDQLQYRQRAIFSQLSPIIQP